MGPPARKKMAVEGTARTTTTTATALDIRLTTVRLAQELNEFCASHTFQKPPTLSISNMVNSATSTANQNLEAVEEDETVVETDLQLAVCRKLRELLPTSNCSALLHTALQQHWIPVLLTWLNLHDRPAVQVEALLAVTNIAELCSNNMAVAAAASHHHHHYPLGTATSASLEAAAAAAMETSSPWATVLPGSVPFPPLSFSQTLSPEAVAAFDASLATTIYKTTTSKAINNNRHDSDSDANKSKNDAYISPLVPLFPSIGCHIAANSVVGGGGINFTSLAPPPGGAHNSVPAFMPPPTPVVNTSGLLSFPQQLSASSQHLLLRHADAIPTLIGLLSSPDKQVYEQAMWILGSICAGDSPGGGGSALDGRGNSTLGSGSSNTNSGGSTSSLDAANNNKTVSARDVILAAGVMNQLLRCLEAHPNNISLQRIGSWTLSNLLDNIFQQQQQHHQSGGQSQTSNNSNSSSQPPLLLSTGVNTSNGGKSSNLSSISGTNRSWSSGEYSSSDEIDMAQLLPVLHRLLHMTDSEVLSYICWSLSYLCDGPASHIAAVVTTPPGSKAKPGGLVPRLVELLVHPSWRVTKPALRTIGNIVCAECSEDTTGSGSAATDYTEVILECNAVPHLKELITHSNREIQKEAAWTLSNIAAGTVDQIQAVIDSGAIPPLVDLVRDKMTDQEVRSEACWVVLNATSCGSDSQIELLVDEGCVSVLGVLLSEASMVMMALEGLERVLQVEEAREMIRREQIENGELEDDEDDENDWPVLVSASLIEKARESHTNSSSVTKRADRIWKQHFVSCALCKQSFSKHRTSDASFCDECKCHVCSNCNCKVYHLDYQEELWAATEEKTEAKKNAKKSKNKKKKAKLKEKKAKQQQDDTTVLSKQQIRPQPSTDREEPDDGYMNNKKASLSADGNKKNDADRPRLPPPPPTSSSQCEAEDATVGLGEEDDSSQNQIDLVLYLQQTGSIIALSKLMDALEYGGDDYDDELDDYERKMIREQQMMRGQQATN